MKNYIILKISAFIFISSIVFFAIALFWYNDFESIKEFIDEFFITKNLFMIVIIFLFSMSIGSLSGLILNNIFKNISVNNNKLKDYNHFLAHELKTPLSIINSHLDILKYGADSVKIDDCKNELKNILKIIDGLLSFSESLQLINPTDINLEIFLKSIINGKQGTIHIINKEFNFFINTDLVLFERVVINLIDNALKYSIDKTLDIYISKNTLIFENNIYSTLDNNDLEKISDKFYSGSYNNNTGNGIGLGMVQEIIQVLDYKMKVTSDNNRFRVGISFEE